MLGFSFFQPRETLEVVYQNNNNNLKNLQIPLRLVLEQKLHVARIIQIV